MTAARPHRSRNHLRGGSMRYALTHYVQLGSVRDVDWVAAHFGHR
jgi:hypothetical protein